MAGLPAPPRCMPLTPTPATAAGLGCIVTWFTWSPAVAGPIWGGGGERNWGVADLGLPLDEAVMDVDGAVEDGGTGWLGTWGDCLRAVTGGGRGMCVCGVGMEGREGKRKDEMGQKCTHTYIHVHVHAYIHACTDRFSETQEDSTHMGTFVNTRVMHVSMITSHWPRMSQANMCMYTCTWL